VPTDLDCLYGAGGWFGGDGGHGGAGGPGGGGGGGWGGPSIGIFKVGSSQITALAGSTITVGAGGPGGAGGGPVVSPVSAGQAGIAKEIYAA
jgi:hypothetical protein